MRDEEYVAALISAFNNAMKGILISEVAKKQQDVWGVTHDDYEEAANYQELQTQGWQQQQELENGHE